MTSSKTPQDVLDAIGKLDASDRGEIFMWVLVSTRVLSETRVLVLDRRHKGFTCLD